MCALAKKQEAILRLETIYKSLELAGNVIQADRVWRILTCLRTGKRTFSVKEKVK